MPQYKHIPFIVQVSTRRDEDERAACTDPYMGTRIEPQQRCNLKSEGYGSVLNQQSIVIVAGEASGDLHAAHFVQQLLATQPNLNISGIGGQHMQAAGVQLISDLARVGVTGLSEVIRHFRTIHTAYKAIKRHLQQQLPALLILVDYPGFNLRLAQWAKQHLPQTRILYYISPQIWAWKAKRIHHIRRYVDQMAVILPFEKQLYQAVDIPVAFVGHPLVQSITTLEQQAPTRQQLGLPCNKRIIALLPGSRIHEIARHMPVLKACAERLHQRFADLHFVIPIANTIAPEQIKAYLTKTTIPFMLIEHRNMAAVACSDFAIVASGTASLECALLQKPMCIIYKSSLITYLAACQLIKVKYLGLCNLLMNRMVVPELLQYDCNVEQLTTVMTDLLTNQTTSTRMLDALQQLRLQLSTQQADCSISELILQEMRLNSTNLP